MGRKEKTGRKQRERGERHEGTAPCDSPGRGFGSPSFQHAVRKGAGPGSSSSNLGESWGRTPCVGCQCGMQGSRPPSVESDI